MSYDMPTSINASKGFAEILYYINSVTNNWISNLFILAIYFIVLIGYYKTKEDFKGGFAVAGYVTFVIALLFWLGGFVSPLALSVVIGIMIIGTLILFLDNN